MPTVAGGRDADSRSGVVVALVNRLHDCSHFAARAAMRDAARDTTSMN
jgi:hypothetical protein